MRKNCFNLGTQVRRASSFQTRLRMDDINPFRNMIDDVLNDSRNLASKIELEQQVICISNTSNLYDIYRLSLHYDLSIAVTKIVMKSYR